MSKHTPGPWVAENFTVYSTLDRYLPTVATCPDSSAMSEGEAKANARLVSAAPDLLDALYECILTLTMGDTTPEERVRRLKRAEEAYLKATGGAE